MSNKIDNNVKDDEDKKCVSYKQVPRWDIFWWIVYRDTDIRAYLADKYQLNNRCVQDMGK